MTLRDLLRILDSMDAKELEREVFVKGDTGLLWRIDSFFVGWHPEEERDRAILGVG